MSSIARKAGGMIWICRKEKTTFDGGVRVEFIKTSSRPVIHHQRLAGVVNDLGFSEPALEGRRVGLVYAVSASGIEDPTGGCTRLQCCCHKFFQ